MQHSGWWKMAGLFVILAFASGVYGQPASTGQISFKPVDAEPLGHVTSGAIVLHDNWRMREESVAGNDGARFSAAGFSADGWYRTSVPTTVLGALVHLGVFPDSYIGDNNNKIPDASAPGNPWSNPWWFQRTFQVPAAYAGKATWLHLDGIDCRAEVWVNGKQVASARDTAGMFRRLRFDISSLVSPGHKNALAIRIFAVDYAGIPGYREAGSDAGFQRNVTEMSALGWDWVATARDRNMGIWQHVWIESSGPVAVRDPAAFTDIDLPAAKQASITLRFQLENHTPLPTEAEVIARISPIGFAGTPIEVRHNVTLPPNTTQEVVLTPAQFPALKMSNPRLWWPNGYGAHPLYKLLVEARTKGIVSHRQEAHFGVRKIGYFYRPAEYAHALMPVPDGEYPSDYPALKTARVFTVNDKPIRMVGGSMVPDLLLAWNAQRYRDEVRLMTEDNHTVVRVWGGGLIMPDAFYEEADRRGLLVWQDLARSSFAAAWRKKAAEIPVVEKDLYLSNIRDTVFRLRGRTSLLAWCGTNEAAMQGDIGMALQNEMLPALDGTRPWLPSTATEPEWATEPLGMRSFGPYVMQSLHYYFTQYRQASDFIFKNEIGLESVPRFNSIAKAIPSLEADARSNTWASPELLHHGLPVEHLTSMMTERIAAPANLADFASMSDLLSEQAYRAIFEGANKNRPRNPGTMVWMTNAAWLDHMYQMYDWYLHPTASYYAVKSAIRRLHVQHSIDDNTLQVASTLEENRAVRVRAEVMSADGRQEESREYDLSAARDATTPVGLAPLKLADGDLHFLALTLLDPKGAELDRLVTWTQKDEKWKALSTLASVPVSARLIAQSRLGRETELKIAVKNMGHVPAVDVWVEVIAGSQGGEVLPSFWSDNALNLMPGEERDIAVRFRTSSLGKSTPRLLVEGFNVIPDQFAIVPKDALTHPALHVDALACETHEGHAELNIRYSQTNAPPGRWTSWPIGIDLDGKKLRNVHVAIRGSGFGTLSMPIEMSSGMHHIQVGNKSIEANSR